MRSNKKVSIPKKFEPVPIKTEVFKWGGGMKKSKGKC